MNKSFSTSLLVGLVALFLAGCGVQPGSTIVKYERSGPARLAEAPRDGMYALYASTDTTPKVKYELRRGERLGFEERDGQVVAVAGERSEPIRTSTMTRAYYWKEEKR